MRLDHVAMFLKRVSDQCRTANVVVLDGDIIMEIKGIRFEQRIGNVDADSTVWIEVEEDVEVKGNAEAPEVLERDEHLPPGFKIWDGKRVWQWDGKAWVEPSGDEHDTVHVEFPQPTLKTTVKMADPELERLLAQEEEIERRAHANWRRGKPDVGFADEVNAYAEQNELDDIRAMGIMIGKRNVALKGLLDKMREFGHAPERSRSGLDNCEACNMMADAFDVLVGKNDPPVKQING